MRFPLEELWDEHGVVSGTCEGDLQAEAIRDVLRRRRVRFAVADVGQSLRWVPPDACYAFWKDEVQPHLIELSVVEQGVDLSRLPGEYGYVASLWRADDVPVILLQKFH